MTGSLSVSMRDRGTHMKLARAARPELWIDGTRRPDSDPATRRMAAFLGLFGGPYKVESRSSVPVAAGLASSASAFAAAVRALDAMHDWELAPRLLSILARLGSGSACRSVFDGFVEWRVGQREDGMDSHAVPLDVVWPEFRLGLVTVSSKAKPVGSREAMRRTRETSLLYHAWPEQVASDLAAMRPALATRHLARVGEVAERNALAMHATMLAARPAVCYWQEGTLRALQRVWDLRKKDVPVYATMDAGPNVKLLFEAKHEAAVREALPVMEVL